MSNASLTATAGQLESYLQRKVKFYLRVGWMREDSGSILIVYYDRRESFPKGTVPKRWKTIDVRTQGILPPGSKPPDPADITWMWMVM